MNYKEFAAKIKSKYQGSYDDMDDKTLAQKMVAKFPQYSDVTFDEPEVPQMQQQQAPNPILEGAKTVGGMVASSLPGVGTAVEGLKMANRIQPITPSKIVSDLPGTAAMAAGMAIPGAGPAMIAARIAASGAGAGVGEAAKQAASYLPGINVKPSPSPLNAVASSAGKGALAGATGEAIGVGMNILGSGATKLLKLTSSVNSKAIERGIKNPALTIPDQWKGQVEQAAKEVKASVAGYARNIRAMYEQAVKRSGVVADLRQLDSSDLFLQAGIKPKLDKDGKIVSYVLGKGAEEASTAVQRKLLDIQSRLDVDMRKYKGAVPVERLINLRHFIDDATEWTENVGQQTGNHILKTLRERVDELIEHTSPEVALMDEMYSQLADDLNDVKNIVGVSVNKSTRVSAQATNKMESFVKQFYDGSASSLERLQNIASRLGRGQQLMSKIEDMAANFEFSGAAKAGTYGARQIGSAAAKSPRITGGLIRKTAPIYRAAKSGIPAAIRGLFGYEE